MVLYRACLVSLLVSSNQDNRDLSKSMESTIRRVEEEILDQEYTKFKIPHRDRNLALGHLLKTAGDLWHDERRSQDNRQRFTSARFTIMLGGLGHCIRWLTNTAARRIRLPNATWQELDQEAREFLVWGMQYHLLTIDHIAWSRNMLQANVDIANQIIRFFPASNYDELFLLSQQSDEQRLLEELHNQLPADLLRQDFVHWLRHFKVVHGGFDFAQDMVRQFESYPQIVRWLEASVLPDVGADEDLGGFSLDEFRHFFAALFMNCNFWMWVEDGYDDLFGSEHDFGSSMLTLPQPAMMRWLQHMSALRLESVKAIVSVLTYDTSNLHASLTNQPFVRSANGRLFLLPRLVALSNPGRMLVGAMNKGAGRRIYERMIKGQSSIALSRLARAFQDAGFEVWQEKKIQGDRGPLTPDLIVFDKRHRELLIADYKHALSPVGPSETIYKLRELEKGLGQIRGYLAAMTNPTNWPPEIQASGVNTIMGLLIFGHPMSIPMGTDAEIAVVNRPTLHEYLARSSPAALSAVVDWARTRPELGFRLGMLREHHLSIKVSDWTYVRSVYLPNE